MPDTPNLDPWRNNIALMNRPGSPFAAHPLLGPKGINLAFAEYHRCRADLAKAKIGGRATFGEWLWNHEKRLSEIESGHKARLENLAMEGAGRFLGLMKEELKESILGFELTLRPVAAPESPPSAPPQLLDDRERLCLWKRQLHNAVIHGLAIDGARAVVAEMAPELESMQAGLTRTYTSHLAMAQISHFGKVPRAPSPWVAGWSGLRRKQGRVMIEAQANHFHILVLELCKGWLEREFSFGLPKRGENPALHERWLAQADRPEDEPWYFMVGPEFAIRAHERLRNAYGPKTWRHLATRDWYDFANACGWWWSDHDPSSAPHFVTEPAGRGAS